MDQVDWYCSCLTFNVESQWTRNLILSHVTGWRHLSTRCGWLLRCHSRSISKCLAKPTLAMLNPQGRVADHVRATREVARLKRVVALGSSSSQPYILFSPMIRSPPFFKLLAFIWVISLSHSPALAYYGHESSASRHSPHGPSKKYCQNLLQRREWYVALSSSRTRLIFLSLS